jgi:hypothetical protein
LARPHSTTTNPRPALATTSLARPYTATGDPRPALATPPLARPHSTATGDPRPALATPPLSRPHSTTTNPRPALATTSLTGPQTLPGAGTIATTQARAGTVPAACDWTTPADAGARAAEAGTLATAQAGTVPAANTGPRAAEAGTIATTQARAGTVPAACDRTGKIRPGELAGLQAPTPAWSAAACDPPRTSGSRPARVSERGPVQVPRRARPGIEMSAGVHTLE